MEFACWLCWAGWVYRVKIAASDFPGMACWFGGYWVQFAKEVHLDLGYLDRMLQT